VAGAEIRQGRMMHEGKGEDVRKGRVSQQRDFKLI
jgi:hypothetical protein